MLCNVFWGKSVLERWKATHPPPAKQPTPGAVAQDFVATGFLHMNLFWQLRQHFVAEGIAVFHLTPKGHQIMHCCLLSMALNPRFSWCYTGEDFMGKMRKLALSCAAGNYGQQVSTKVCEKYLIALHCILTDPAAWLWRM